MKPLPRVLSSLVAGERCWFVLASHAERVSALALLPFRTEGSARQAQVTAQSLTSHGVTVHVGLAAVGMDGAIGFGGPLLDASLLERLATWVRIGTAAEPALAHLSGARFWRTSAGGKVEETIEQPALWGGIARPMVAGGPDDCRQRLAEMAPQQPHWFWCCAQGPGAAPMLWVQPIDTDPEGTLFGARVLALRKQSLGQDAGVRGTVVRGEQGRLLFSTPQPLDALASVLEALGEGAWELGALRMVQLRRAGVTDTRTLGADGLDLSAMVAALGTVESGEGPSFWLTTQDSSGSSRLLLAHDRKALRAAATAAGGGGSTYRGQLQRGRRWLELHTRSAPEGLLAALAAFVAAHIERWPGLAPLIGSRVVQVGEDGAVLKKVQDRAVWAALSASHHANS